MKRTIIFVLLAPFLLSWSGYVHQYMAEIAIERLPQEQIDVMGRYREDLISIYCLIPDKERSDSIYKPYLDSFFESYMLIDIPRSIERNILHHADRSENNYMVYEYYTKTICEKLKEGDIEEAMKYLGTFLHFLQDTSCPAHNRFGRYQLMRGEERDLLDEHFASLNYFKRFMPVPEKYKDIRFHRIIDPAGFDLVQLRERVGNYEPSLLGENLSSLINTLKVRHEEMMAESDKTLLYMLQARLNDDNEKFAKYGLDAAEPSVKLAADFMYTIMEIYTNTN